MARPTRGASIASTKITAHGNIGNQHGKNGVWTDEEDLLLATWQKKVGNKWSEVAKQIPGKTGQQCAQRWRHRVNPNIKRDKWDEHEDELLTRLVQEHGNHWATIARHVPGRTDQQCMGRWKRHLDPSIKRDKWSVQEDINLCALYLKYDNAWSSISRALDGRTPQQCRTRWHNLKTSSFMTRHQNEIHNVDIDVIEQAALVKIDNGKRYHFAGSSSPAGGYGTSEENFQHNITMNQKDDIDSDTQTQRKRKRGRPMKVVSHPEPVEKTTRARGRPRKHPTQLETPPNVIESRMMNIPALDFVDPRDRHAKKRLSFESNVEGFRRIAHRDEKVPSKRTRYVDGLDIFNEEDDSWIAGCGYEIERFNNRPSSRAEPNDVEEGIMLPVNVNTMLAMTPPKPKSKRELLESQKFSKAPLYQNEETILGLEDMVGQDFAGSRTPLSALRHAPKSCYSPALVDLLRSPPMTHDTYHNRAIGFHGFGSPAAHQGRLHHFNWNTNMTPNRSHTHLDVVRCLDADIEWAGERLEKSQPIHFEKSCKHAEHMTGTLNQPNFTPGTVIGMNPPLVLDSTPRMAPGTVMMRNHVDHSGDDHLQRYVAFNAPPIVDAEDSKLLPVKVVPTAEASTKELVPMSGGDHAFSETCFNLSKDLALQGLPDQVQNDILKTRTRRLSSASVRMCLHALLENA